MVSGNQFLQCSICLCEMMHFDLFIYCPHFSRKFKIVATFKSSYHNQGEQIMPTEQALPHLRVVPCDTQCPCFARQIFLLKLDNEHTMVKFLIICKPNSYQNQQQKSLLTTRIVGLNPESHATKYQCMLCACLVALLLDRASLIVCIFKAEQTVFGKLGYYNQKVNSMVLTWDSKDCAKELKFCLLCS